MTSSSSPKEPNKYHRYGRFHKYTSYLEVKLHLHENKIVSIIQEGTTDFFIYLKNLRKFRIHVDYNQPSEKLCGLHYFSWVFEENEIDSSNMKDQNNCVRNCLLLPWQLHETQSIWHMYAIISDDWYTMIHDYKFVLPFMTSCP